MNKNVRTRTTNKWIVPMDNAFISIERDVGSKNAILSGRPHHELPRFDIVVTQEEAEAIVDMIKAAFANCRDN